MIIADKRDKINTISKVCCRKDIDRGFCSSTVDVLISLNLLIRPLSVLPYPAKEEMEAKDEISSLSS